MTFEERRTDILRALNSTKQPISASTFGAKYGVTRQIIVNDIALLRAGGTKIIALPRGYAIEEENSSAYIIASHHSKDNIKEELLTIIEHGCGVIDVVVEHSIYGRISEQLHIYTKNDVEKFVEKMEQNQTQPLCSLTNDFHYHTLTCPTPEHFKQIEAILKEKGLCL